jgi:hypothetical protein
MGSMVTDDGDRLIVGVIPRVYSLDLAEVRTFFGTIAKARVEAERGRSSGGECGRRFVHKVRADGYCSSLDGIGCSSSYPNGKCTVRRDTRSAM